MPFCSVIKSLWRCSVWKRYLCFFCLFYEQQKYIEKEEMGHAGEKWNKMRGKVGEIRLSGLAVKTAPNGVVAGPKAPLYVQAGPDRAESV